MKVIRPTWSHVRDSNYIAVERNGAVLLEFAKSVGERAYDWSNKQVFALSPTELGSLISWQRDAKLEFFHDPNKQRSNEGQVVKILTLSVAPSGDVFMGMLVKEQGKADQAINLPLSKGEFAVIARLAEYLIPRLLGIEELFHYPPEYGLEGGGSDQKST